MVSSLAVCREILRIGKEEGIDDISPLKLIKLAYICQGFHLAVVDEPLFEDKVEAWKYGPVVRRIYDAVSHYRKNSILPNQFDHVEGELNEDAMTIIKGVMNAYGELEGLQLSTITHKKGTPWHEIRSEWASGTVIPNPLIKKHYKKILTDYAQSKSG